MKRALIVHNGLIWNDGYRILKLVHRVENLEREVAELKATLERITTPGVN